MKANEIQIGDLVFANGTHRKVCAITKKKIGYHREETLDFTRLHYSVLREVTPIHLTPEILEKNRFYISQEYEMVFSAVYDANMGLFYDVTQEPYVFDWAEHQGVDFRYVHELQHALRLCGLNELADNFKV